MEYTSPREMVEVVCFSGQYYDEQRGTITDFGYSAREGKHMGDKSKGLLFSSQLRVLPQDKPALYDFLIHATEQKLNEREVQLRLWAIASKKDAMPLTLDGLERLVRGAKMRMVEPVSLEIKSC